MQAEMLDSTVSNSMQLFQNAGFKIRVIMRLGNPWFVAKDVCECLDLANSRDAVSRLDDDEKGVGKADTLGGSQDMMLISESGLYTLVMRSNKPEAKVFRKWVTSEVLPSIRKTGSYSVAQAQPTIYDYARALIAEKERSDALEAQNKALALERDEAIRTKAMIGSRREATAMAIASAKSRECAKLTAENDELKDAVGRGTHWRTVSVMTAEWIRDFGHAPSWHKLKEFSADLPTDMQPIKDVEEKVVLRNGSEKVRKVNRYHIEAWDRYRQYEENLRATNTEEVF